MRICKEAATVEIRFHVRFGSQADLVLYVAGARNNPPPIDGWKAQNGIRFKGETK